VAATGVPIYVTGRKVVKISGFLLSGDKSFTLQPFEEHDSSCRCC
jgi:hypothetical protein